MTFIFHFLAYCNRKGFEWSPWWGREEYGSDRAVSFGWLWFGVRIEWPRKAKEAKP